MLLTELFNDSYEFKWLHATRSLIAARFTADDETIIQVEFIKQEGHDIEDNDWALWFERSEGKQRYNTSYKITKQGDAYKIFATISQILEQFVQMKDPDSIRFSGEERSRAKLYRRILPRLASKMNMDFTHDTSEDTEQFYLKKRK